MTPRHGSAGREWGHKAPDQLVQGNIAEDPPGRPPRPAYPHKRMRKQIPSGGKTKRHDTNIKSSIGFAGRGFADSIVKIGEQGRLGRGSRDSVGEKGG